MSRVPREPSAAGGLHSEVVRQTELLGDCARQHGQQLLGDRTRLCLQDMALASAGGGGGGGVLVLKRRCACGTVACNTLAMRVLKRRMGLARVGLARVAMAIHSVCAGLEEALRRMGLVP